MTGAHDQHITHRYVIHYPEHPARQDDPHYKDFNEYHRRHRQTARCQMGERLGFSECATADGSPALVDEHGFQPGLELHHSHVEFALANLVDFDLLETDYPGISDRDQIGAWIETAQNLVWLCSAHHRGAGGIHNASASDWEAEHYIRGLISPGRKQLSLVRGASHISDRLRSWLSRHAA